LVSTICLLRSVNFPRVSRAFCRAPIGGVLTTSAFRCLVGDLALKAAIAIVREVSDVLIEAGRAAHRAEHEVRVSAAGEGCSQQQSSE
jgi:hypothetical protein